MALGEIGGHDPDDVRPADGALGSSAHYLDGAVRAEADVAALEKDHLARVLGVDSITRSPTRYEIVKFIIEVKSVINAASLC